MYEFVQQEKKNEQVNWWEHELNNQQKSTRSSSANQAKRKHLNDERAWRVGEKQCPVEEKHGHVHLQEQDFGKEIKIAKNNSVQ